MGKKKERKKEINKEKRKKKKERKKERKDERTVDRAAKINMRLNLLKQRIFLIHVYFLEIYTHKNYVLSFSLLAFLSF